MTTAIDYSAMHMDVYRIQRDGENLFRCSVGQILITDAGTLTFSANELPNVLLLDTFGSIQRLRIKDGLSWGEIRRTCGGSYTGLTDWHLDDECPYSDGPLKIEVEILDPPRKLGSQEDAKKLIAELHRKEEAAEFSSDVRMAVGRAASYALTVDKDEKSSEFNLTAFLHRLRERGYAVQKMPE